MKPELATIYIMVRMSYTRALEVLKDNDLPDHDVVLLSEYLFKLSVLEEEILECVPLIGSDEPYPFFVLDLVRECGEIQEEICKLGHFSLELH